MPTTQTSANRTNGKVAHGFTAEERAAMRQRAREAKAGASAADAEKDCLASIADMQQPDRAIAERLHAIIKSCAPSVSAKTWYGMPAYAIDGNVVCFFQTRYKFKNRYATLGFSDKASLDDGEIWPNSYAVTELTPAVEAKIIDLVKQAVR